MVLEATRFAPSGQNEQNTEFVVVRDRKTIHEIASLTTAYLDKLVKQIQNPIARMFMRRSLGHRGGSYVANLAPELAHLVPLFNEFRTSNP